MLKQTEIINFGDVICFVIPSSAQEVSKRNAKNNLHIEIKRYVVVIEVNDDGSTEDIYDVLAERNCLYLEFYEKKSKYKKGKPLTHAIELCPNAFCGINNGTITSDNSRQSPQTYIALIFLDFTAMFLLSGNGEAKMKTKSMISLLNRKLGHEVTRCMRLSGIPAGEREISAGQEVLLSVTKHRVTLSSKKTHLTCLCSWQLTDVTCMAVDSKILLIQVQERGSYSFTTSHSNEFCAKITQARREMEISPVYITHIKAASKPDVVPVTSCEDPPCPSKWDKLYETYESELSSEGSLSTSFDLNEEAERYMNCNLASESASGIGVVSSLPLVMSEKKQQPSFKRQTSEPQSAASSSKSKSTNCPNMRLSDLYPQHLFMETLVRILRHKSPGNDTLGLPKRLRFELCMKLYQCSPSSIGGNGDWEILAEEIGLKSEAVELISSTVRNHCLYYTYAEVVLRHWQFVYNKYGQTVPTGKCPHPCTVDALLAILERIPRHDLVDLIKAWKQ